MATSKNIPIKNIYFMLSYAYRELTQGEYEPLSKVEFENIHDLFAGILNLGISRQLKQGLYREYSTQIESLPTVRGKIDLAGTVKNRVARKPPVCCEYDELSADNLLNRILKTTSLLLIRHGNVKTERREGLQKTMRYFAQIGEVSPKSIRWSTLRFNQSNRGYRFLMVICKMVIDGMLISEETGEITLRKLLYEKQMHDLYEKFILGYYKHEHGELSPNAPEIKWALDDEETGMLPKMYSDIVLSKDGTYLVIDAKYYTIDYQTNYGKMTVKSANLYQIFTYVKNKEAELAGSGLPHTVSGMLLYAKTGSENQIKGKWSMSGNTIEAKVLNLDCEWAEIKGQLDGIVEEYFG